MNFAKVDAVGAACRASYIRRFRLYRPGQSIASLGWSLLAAAPDLIVTRASGLAACTKASGALALGLR